MPNPITPQTHLRIARPTNSIPSLLPFYTLGLKFTILSTFTNHSGFSGVMLGLPSARYHLEFTHNPSHGRVPRAPTEDNLLLFYVEGESEWTAAVERMERAEVGAKRVPAVNPYWEVEGRGRTYEDAEGWRVVIWRGGWVNAVKG